MGPPMSIDDAIQILQRNELGRQGRQRFRVMKQMAAQEEKDRKMAESGGGQEGEEDRVPGVHHGVMRRKASKMAWRTFSVSDSFARGRRHAVRKAKLTSC